MKNFERYLALAPEEQKRLQQEMHRALQPRRPSDGLIDPMVKPDGSAFFGEEPVYPYFAPNADGTINPVVLAADFIDGPPPDLTYQPGYTIPGTSADGCPLGTVRYRDESLNLPLGLSALSASAPGDLAVQAMANHLHQRFPPLQRQFSLPPLPQGEDFVRYDPEKRGANFVANPTHIRAVHRGNERTRFLCLNALCGKETMVFTHKLSDLQSLPSALIRAFPACDLGSNPAKNGQELVSDLRSKLMGLPEHHAYLTPGWADVAGTLLYVHDGATPPHPQISFETGRRIPVDHTLSRTGAFRSALSFLDISPRLERTLPLLLFAYLGPLFTLFELAGCPPQVVLFVHGRTGSLKTATTSLIYNLFQEKPAISATFKDTAAALGNL